MLLSILLCLKSILVKIKYIVYKCKCSQKILDFKNFLNAEIGINHNSSIQLAKKLID